jgi:hypothetical protein
VFNIRKWRAFKAWFQHVSTHHIPKKTKAFYSRIWPSSHMWDKKKITVITIIIDNYIYYIIYYHILQSVLNPYMDSYMFFCQHIHPTGWTFSGSIHLDPVWVSEVPDLSYIGRSKNSVPLYLVGYTSFSNRYIPSGSQTSRRVGNGPSKNSIFM